MGAVLSSKRSPKQLTYLFDEADLGMGGLLGGTGSCILESSLLAGPSFSPFEMFDLFAPHQEERFALFEPQILEENILFGPQKTQEGLQDVPYCIVQQCEYGDL